MTEGSQTQQTEEPKSLVNQPDSPVETEQAKSNGEQKEEPKAEPKAQEAPPLTVKDIVLPEGFEGVDTASQEAFVSILNEYKVPAEGLKKLVDLQTGIMKAASEKGSALWNQTQDTWRKEIMADAEFGGPRLNENLGQISRLIDKYGTSKLRDMMDLTGAGNHPEMIKFLTKVARDNLAEGQPVTGQPSRGERTHADILFPNQGKT